MDDTQSKLDAVANALRDRLGGRFRAVRVRPDRALNEESGEEYDTLVEDHDGVDSRVVLIGSGLAHTGRSIRIFVPLSLDLLGGAAPRDVAKALEPAARRKLEELA